MNYVASKQHHQQSKPSVPIDFTMDVALCTNSMKKSVERLLRTSTGLASLLTSLNEEQRDSRGITEEHIEKLEAGAATSQPEKVHNTFCPSAAPLSVMYSFSTCG